MGVYFIVRPKTMSDTQPDKEFFELADSFIHLANKHCNDVRRTKVSATILYATARFNAFVVASSTKRKDQLTSEKEVATAYLVEQYEKMLRENLDDYESNYKKYKGQSERPKR